MNLTIGGLDEMSRINLFLLASACLCMLSGIVHAQGANLGGATIRGEVIDTSPENKPIEGVTVKIVYFDNEQEYVVTTDKDGDFEITGLPEGRYTISVSKNGYGDRVGRSKVVAAGGEIFERIKMRKIDTLITFLQRQPLIWLFLAGITVVIIFVIVILLIDFSRPRYRGM